PTAAELLPLPLPVLTTTTEGALRRPSGRGSSVGASSVGGGAGASVMASVCRLRAAARSGEPRQMGVVVEADELDPGRLLVPRVVRDAPLGDRGVGGVEPGPAARRVGIETEPRDERVE